VRSRVDEADDQERGAINPFSNSFRQFFPALGCDNRMLGGDALAGAHYNSPP
jgi:hypothetical protein